MFLTKKAWRNIIQDVEAKTHYGFNSDHAVVTADIKVKLKAKWRDMKLPIKRYRKPDNDKSEKYNAAVAEYFTQYQASYTDCGAAINLAHAVASAAEEHLAPIDDRQNREYISEQTWQLILDREAARSRGDAAKEQTLNREIKKGARKDKKSWRLEKLETWSDSRTNWKHIKAEKAEFKPNFYGMKDLDGNRVPMNKKAEALAEYLHQKQWGPKPSEKKIPLSNRPKVIDESLGISTSDITEEEVDAAQARLKNNKAPGPDGVVAELYAWLKDDGKKCLHAAPQENWRRKKIGEYENAANIASLYKKGDHENPENYRPISLLNVTYKLMAYIVHQRISEKLDPLLGDLQSGFRPGRSTVDPLYCVRRLQDVVEKGKDRLILIFLDWEKSFDEIDQEKMFEALKRLNIPDDMIQMIRAMYWEPYFRVQQTDQASEWKEQRTGIRQGCPLSPFLFILTMHVVFQDIKQNLRDPYCQRTFCRINFKELLYADDTLLIAKTTAMANKMLHLVEKESEYYDLALNKNKCNHISFHHNANIRFHNGEEMKRVEEAVYLGANITKTVDPRLEIQRRVSATMPVLRKLDILWNQTKCCNAWKIQVFNSVIVSKLIYGLETVEPTANAAQALDTLQLKGLRKILEMKTTFIDRANTNEVPYKKAQDVMRSKNHTKPEHCRKRIEWLERQVRPITEVLKEKNLTFLDTSSADHRHTPCNRSLSTQQWIADGGDPSPLRPETLQGETVGLGYTGPRKTWKEHGEQ